MVGSILGSLTVALIAMALIYSFASISGAHMNPAVTVALWSSNRTSARKAIMYIVAQLVGANLAMLALFFSFNFDTTIFAAAAVTPAAGSNVFSVFFMEFALTFVLVFIILKVAFEDVEDEVSKATHTHSDTRTSHRTVVERCRRLWRVIRQCYSCSLLVLL